MSEEQIKEEIEQIGYQEFYRYYQEAGILVEQQKQEIERLKKYIEAINRWIDSNIEAGNIYCYDTTPFPKLEGKK